MNAYERNELILVIAVTVFFLLLGIVAVGIFLRVMHKERQAELALKRKTDANHPSE